MTRGEFQKPWTAPLSVTWPGIELRTATGRLVEARGIPVLIDRRVDPSTEVRLERQDTPLADIVADLAAETRLGLSVVRPVVYLGPPDRARVLRTAIAQREAELAAMATPAKEEPHRDALLRPRVLRWDEASEPRELLQNWCQLFALEPVGIETVPHDLWGANGWSGLTAAEGLCVMLIQFDLGFEWRVEQGRVTGIRIVPFPVDVRIERDYSPPKGKSAQLWMDELRAEKPLARIEMVRNEAAGNRLRVAATVEEHESLTERLKGTSRSKTEPRPRPGMSKEADTLDRKRFTLSVKDVPAQALLDTLTANPDARLTYDYDREAFEKAGVSFSKRVSVSVKNATIDDLLDQIAKALGIDYEREERGVLWRLDRDDSRQQEASP